MTTQSDRGLKNCPWCGQAPASTLGSMGNLWVECMTEDCPLSRLPAMKETEWIKYGPAVPGTAEVSEGMVEAAYQHLKATVGKNTSDMRMNSVGLVLFTISDVRAALSAALKAQKGVGAAAPSIANHPRTK